MAISEAPGGRTGGRSQRVLDRASIVAAAIDLVDREGLDALNMRALAQEMGVGTMSLYHHVPNKEALLEAIVERLLSEIEIPPADSGSWDQRAARMARSLREVALRHPGCVPLLVTKTFATPASLRPCEAAFDALAEAGLNTEQALIAFRTIVAYVLGFVMMESAGFFRSVGPDRSPDELAELGLPRLAELSAHMHDRDVTADFDTGLRLVELGAIAGLLGHLQAGG